MTISFSSIPDCPTVQPFAECHGIDLSVGLGRDERALIKRRLLEHGLLVFRNQDNMTPANEVAFNQAFGWHDRTQKAFLFGFGAPTDTHQVGGGAQLPDWPQVSVLGNATLDNYHGLRQVQLVPQLGFSYAGWHADGLHDMFSGMPELTTMYNPVGWRTTGGGETYFTSGVLAVDRMDGALERELSDCVVAYVRCPNDEAPDASRQVSPGPTYMGDEGTRRLGFARDMHNPEAGLIDFEYSPQHADQGGRHPCIRIHPVTRQKSLYVSPGKAVCLLDRQTGEMRYGVTQTGTLLSKALLPSVTREIRYEHQWREGDFVAWINTLVLHSASDPVHIKGQRLLHRVRLSTPKAGS